MDLLHGIDGREKNIPCMVPGQGPGLFQPVFQVFPLHKVHDDVSGIVLLEQIQHPDDLGDSADPGHFPGLFQKHLPAAVPGGSARFRVVPLQSAACLGAADLGGGEVFLNGNLAFQSQVPAAVGNAEAALSQDGAHHIFSVQDRPRLQGIGKGALRSRVISAVGTGVGADRFHAAKTAIKFHLHILLSLGSPERMLPVSLPFPRRTGQARTGPEVL